VPTHGHGDEEAVAEAVAARPAYLGMVGVASAGAAAVAFGYLAGPVALPREPASTGPVPGRPLPGQDELRNQGDRLAIVLSWPSSVPAARATGPVAPGAAASTPPAAIQSAIESPAAKHGAEAVDPSAG